MNNRDALTELISLGQYIHWADINFNRYMCEDGTNTENLAFAFQWFASMFPVIEGWCSLKVSNEEIDFLLKKNHAGVERLRRARNAVYHYQRFPMDERLIEFSNHYGECAWLIDLHQAFLKFLKEYPSFICGNSTEKLAELESYFYDAIGWKPTPLDQ